ncbi:hypothetical protein GCM10029964_032470 [Kibdelosporangium lantanae]
MSDAFPRRREALRGQLRDRGLDALLVVDLLNIRYLTGFTGSNAALVVHAADDEHSIFCTDGRYLTQSAEQVPDLERVIDRESARAGRAGGQGALPQDRVREPARDRRAVGRVG